MAITIPTINNPLGKVFQSAELDALIANLKTVWDGVKANIKSFDFAPVYNFVLRSTEELVMYMVQHDIPGQDKKATVLDAVGKLYDYAISGFLPIWLRPFSGTIRHVVVDVVASGTVDWLCEKFNGLPGVSTLPPAATPTPQV